MKIRKAIKIAITGSVFALPAIVAAQGVGDFTTGASGTDTLISAANLDGMTCSATSGTEDGFLQRTCNNTAGDNFIQTIVFESDPEEGDFSDSSVVMTGGSGQNGVTDVNHITDGADFESLQQIQTDTMLTKNLLGSGNAIDFKQTVSDNSITDETFTNYFNYVEDSAENGSIFLNQHLLNDSTSIPDENIAQNFDHFEVFAASDGQATAGPVTFAAGDYLATTLINSSAGGAFFSLQDFADENTSGETGVDSLATTAPHYDITYTGGGGDVFTYQTF